MKIFSSLVVAALLAFGLVSTSAEAAPITLGTSKNVAHAGGGTDYFSFSLSQTSTVTGVIIDLQYIPDVNGSYVVSLFQGAEGSGTLVANLASTGSAAGFSYGLLGAGSYYFQVASTLVGSALAVNYIFGANAVAATPIPPALLLFASALGGLGFFGYRRRKLAA